MVDGMRKMRGGDKLNEIVVSFTHSTGFFKGQDAFLDPQPQQ